MTDAQKLQREISQRLIRQLQERRGGLGIYDLNHVVVNGETRLYLAFRDGHRRAAAEQKWFERLMEESDD